ncbi:MAG: hypothetical protein WCF19_07820 [Chlamydiales bacterium]
MNVQNFNQAPTNQKTFPITKDAIWVVQQHTVSRWFVVIPIFGWLYMCLKSYLKSTALDGLKSAWKSISPSARLTGKQQKLYNAATKIIINNVSTPESRLQLQKNKFQLQIRQAISAEQANPNFHILMRYYLFVAAKGNPLMLQDKVGYKHLICEQLENIRDNLDQELLRDGYSQVSSDQLISLWLREMVPVFPKPRQQRLTESVSPETYLFEAEILTSMRKIFGHLWTPDFIERIFPIYLDLASSSLKAGLEITQELLNCIPYETSEIGWAVGTYRFDAEKINLLKLAINDLDNNLKDAPTLKIKFHLSRQWIENTIETNQYESTSCDIITNTVLRLLTLWNDPKYQTANKSNLFKYLSILGSIDDSENTLHQIDGFLCLNKELFLQEARLYQPTKNVNLLQHCNQVFSKEIFKNWNFSPEQYAYAFEICMALRSIGSNKETFLYIARKVCFCLAEYAQDFTQKFEEWKKSKKLQLSGIEFIDGIFVHYKKTLVLDGLMAICPTLALTEQEALHILDGLKILIPDLDRRLEQIKNREDMLLVIETSWDECADRYLTDNKCAEEDRLLILQTALARRGQNDTVDDFRKTIAQCLALQLKRQQ